MARPSKKPKYQEDVFDALARGVPLREIERVMHGLVSKSTIQRWAQEWKPSIAERAKEIVAAVNVPIDDAEIEFEADASNLDKLRALLDKTWQSISTAEAAGNLTVASQMMRHAAALGATITRIEKGDAVNADVLTISRRGIEESMARVMLRVKAICERPLLCANCGVALSIEWGEDEDDKDKKK